MSGSRRRVASYAVVVVLIVLGAGAAVASPPPVQVQGAWVRWLPPGVPNTALFGEIVNTTDHVVKLVGASTELAERCEPMTTVRKDSGSTSGPEIAMVKVPSLDVPAHGRRLLEPGGAHLMILGLKRALAAGDKVAITLRFEGADPVTVSAPVLRR